MSKMVKKNLKIKEKVCKDCGIKVDDNNGARVNGYLKRQCRECRRKFHNELNKKKRDRLKLFKSWYG